MDALFMTFVVTCHPWMVPLWTCDDPAYFPVDVSNRRDVSLHDPTLRWSRQEHQHERIRYPQSPIRPTLTSQVQPAELPDGSWEDEGAWLLLRRDDLAVVPIDGERYTSVSSETSIDDQPIDGREDFLRTSSTPEVAPVVRRPHQDRTPVVRRSSQEIAGRPSEHVESIPKQPAVRSTPDPLEIVPPSPTVTAVNPSVAHRDGHDPGVSVIPVVAVPIQDEQKAKQDEAAKVAAESQSERQDESKEETRHVSPRGEDESLSACAPLVRIEKAVLKIIESVNVPAQRSGLLKQMDTREGQVVERGTLLGCIDESQAELHLQEAKIELDIAKREAGDDINVRFAHKSLAVAQAELARGEELHTGEFKLITETEIDRLRLIVDKTNLEIERAQLELGILEAKVDLKSNEVELREDDLARHQIFSPLDGMVVSVDRREGEWIKESETLVRIVRIDRLRVEGLVPAEIAAEGLQGNRVELVLGESSDADSTYHGEVVFVNPEAVTIANQAHVRVWAEVENVGRPLFPGQNGTLLIYPKATKPTEED